MTIDVKSITWGVNADGGYLQIGTESPQIAVTAAESVEDGKEYFVEIKRKRRRRSLDANAYCWVLIGKLSAALHLPPEEVYRAAIRDVGDNYEILPIRAEAVEKFTEAWSGHGIGWICDTIGDSDTDGYINVRAFYGSSFYDTAQMSRLIEIIVQDCKAQGIETMTPEELAKLQEV